MSEAYWFGHRRLEALTELPPALQGLGFEPGWIEEIHWIHSSSPLDHALFPVFAQFEWHQISHPLRLLHLLLNELIHGQRHTLLWMEKCPRNQYYTTVLGSPATVGRFNLLPTYRLLPLPPVHGNWQKIFTDWQGYLAQADLQTTPDWMVYPSEADKTSQAFFPQTRRIIPPDSMTGIERLAFALEESRSFSASGGLWIDEMSPYLALFIESK